MLIDTHCHIYLQDFDPDKKEMISRAENEGVAQFFMPAIDQESYPQMMEMELLFPGKCLAMMGLHPCSVKADFEEQLGFARKWLEKRKFAAIGESGLDFYWDLTFKKEQLIAFNRQIEWARELKIPVIIHSRNSLDECIRVIQENQRGDLRGIFHCFSGTEEQANKITGLGFYMGIGGVVTFKNSGLDKVIQKTGLKQVVLETDAPYLAPVPFRGKRNEPAFLSHVVEKLSVICGMSKEKITEITTGNAKELFNI